MKIIFHLLIIILLILKITCINYELTDGEETRMTIESGNLYSFNLQVEYGKIVEFSFIFSDSITYNNDLFDYKFIFETVNQFYSPVGYETINFYSKHVGSYYILNYSYKIQYEYSTSLVIQFQTRLNIINFKINEILLKIKMMMIIYYKQENQ